MNDEDFSNCYSGEVYETPLKSYPGETALGIKFSIVLSPVHINKFREELNELIAKYEL